MSPEPAIALLLLVGAPLLMPAPMESCSLISIPPTTDALEPLVAITGVVQDKGLRPFPETLEQVPTLTVAVSGSVLGALDQSHVNVYLFGYFIDCEEIPLRTKKLEEYPTGAEVSIIAEARTLDSGKPYLVARTKTFGFVALPPGFTPRTESGLLDFKLFRSSYEPNSSSEWSDQVARRNFHRQEFEDFEYLRALRALRHAAQEHRLSIAENLIYYRGWSGYRAELALDNFEGLLERFEVEPSGRAALVRAFEEHHLGG